MLILLLLLLAICGQAATLVSTATGNFTAAGTWGVVEAGASAAQLTRTTNTNTTTAYVYSSAFTCTNLDVVEGVLVFGRRLGTTGTVSVALSEDNGTTATRELAINASDMQDEDSLHFFQFASTLTCDGGADYKVGVKSSTNAQATFYRDGTAGNWFRALRTSATGAPAAADIIYIAGEWTGAGAVTALTVTMDNTAATVFGAVAATESIGIGSNGTLTYGVAAATNYLLTIAGVVKVFDGGTWNQGTSGTRCPSDSTCKLTFDLTSNVDSGLHCETGGTCNVYGATVTTLSTLLNTDEAAAQTVLGVAATSGWAANGEIAIAPTTRTAAEAEKRTIQSVDSATQVTVTAGLTNAHSGTSPAQAEVVYLTRNALIQGESDTLQGYIRCATTAACTFSYTEFYRLGSATATKRGIDCLSTTGSCSITNSSLHDFVVASSIGTYASGSAVNNVTFTGNVGYALANNLFRIDTTTGTSWTVTGNVSVRTASGSEPTFYMDDLGGTFNTNTAAGGAFVGFDLRQAVVANYTDLTAHSNGSSGVRFVGTWSVTGLTFTNPKMWRNSAQGFSTFQCDMVDLTIDTGVFFGNTTKHIDSDCAYGFTILNSTFAGDTTFATTIGWDPNTDLEYYGARIVNTTFGVASGILTTHSTADINLGTGVYDVTFDNVNLASSTPFTDLATAGAKSPSKLKFQKYGQTAGDHRTFYPQGSILSDTTTFKAASPAQQIKPVSAAKKTQSASWLVPVDSGSTVAATVWVRKSTAGDSCGAEYNGAEPRLIVKKNVSMGITADTVLDTFTAANGNWEQLTGTTVAVTADGVLELVVDGDGTTGCFYVDDWAVVGSDPSAMKYWYEGLPFGGGGSGTSSSVSIGGGGLGKGCHPVVF